MKLRSFFIQVGERERERDLVGIVLGFPKSEGVIVQTKLAMPHVGIPRDLDLERCILGVC